MVSKKTKLHNTMGEEIKDIKNLALQRKITVIRNSTETSGEKERDYNIILF